MFDFLRNIYLSRRFFLVATLLVLLLIVGFFYPFVGQISLFLFVLLGLGAFTDTILLYKEKASFSARRSCDEMFSIGDDNKVKVYLKSFYPFKVTAHVLEEAPKQFQLRDLVFKEDFESGEEKIIQYEVRPTKRGDYHFGNINILLRSSLSLIVRRMQFDEGQNVKVYPSIIQMKRTEQLLFSHMHHAQGIKKIRRAGQNTEFEEIKEYSRGDDYRRINWKATARKRQLMINVFQEEKSRPIYCVINKGRNMMMPFEGLSLLDYSINASLALSNAVLKRGDKAGLITFEKKIDSFLMAEAKRSQLKGILEHLYGQKTDFAEPSYYRLFSFVRNKLSQRSMLLMFSNFESLSSLEAQLPLLKRLNKNHLLVVVIFENTELKEVLSRRAKDRKEAYHISIAEKFYLEKRTIQNELRKNGIQCLLTPPSQLTINVINKYLELKQRALM